MDMTEAISVSEKLDQEPNNGNGHIHTLKQREDSYQSAYEAGLASGKEAGYRRGYREGFSDCCKLGNPARKAAATSHTSTGASKKAAANCASRLRGLPCANCGCSSYSDEVQCPCCGTPKARVVGEQSTAVEESQSFAKMLSGDKLDHVSEFSRHYPKEKNNAVLVRWFVTETAKVYGAAICLTVT